MNVSVLILTLNEASDIAACIASTGSDDVVVLDSFSGDATADIARAAGARVEQRQFDDYAKQRNHGLHEIPFKHEWVLMLDADERVTAELKKEIDAVIADGATGISLYRMRRRDHLFGRWIRGASGYPTWFGRLVRPMQVRVLRPINEEYHTDGGTGSLQGHLDHFPFSKGFSAWILRHDKYSTMEARLMESRSTKPLRLRNLWSGDVDLRRRELKSLVYGLPARPVVVFAALYIWRQGFMEGRAGFTFCLLRAWYEFMIDCKRRELRRRRLGQDI